MATWLNRDLVVFHGTDDRALSSMASGLSVGACRARTDFGQGFYTSTNLHQAKQWANSRVRSAMRSGRRTTAVVLEYKVDRNLLARMEVLTFLRATADFWAFVGDCRAGVVPHQRSGPTARYDVVFGPVTLWPQKLLIADCDQISFHTQPALSLLQKVVLLRARHAPGFF